MLSSFENTAKSIRATRFQGLNLTVRDMFVRRNSKIISSFAKTQAQAIQIPPKGWV